MPQSDEEFETQRTWADTSLMLFRDLLPLMAPVARFPGLSADERHVLGCLLSATARSSESVLLLCAHGQLWDAEVIQRSVLEATLKFAYLLRDQRGFRKRHDEYATALFNIALLKDHDKAAAVLDAVPDPNSPRWKPIRDCLLKQSDREAIATVYPKAVRRRLEMRWGLSGLLSELDKSDGGSVHGIRSLAHGYAMASHIHHADYVGTSIPIERDLRSEERRVAIHFAHLSRIISDVFSYLQIRLYIGYRFVAQDSAPLAEAAQRIDSLQSFFGSAFDEWMNIEYS